MLVNEECLKRKGSGTLKQVHRQSNGAYGGRVDSKSCLSHGERVALCL